MVAQPSTQQAAQRLFSTCDKGQEFRRQLLYQKPFCRNNKRLHKYYQDDGTEQVQTLLGRWLPHVELMYSEQGCGSLWLIGGSRPEIGWNP